MPRASLPPPPIPVKGRGAWNSNGHADATSTHYKLGDGAGDVTNDQAIWAVNQGVLSIQSRLNVLLGGGIWGSGVYDQVTADAVKKFQIWKGLSSTGEVDVATAKTMFQSLCDYYAMKYVIPQVVMRSVPGIESGWDPGAVGSLNANDWGICQLSHVAPPSEIPGPRPIPAEQAFDPNFAFESVAIALTTRMNQPAYFKSWVGVIASWNSPVRALKMIDLCQTDPDVLRAFQYCTWAINHSD